VSGFLLDIHVVIWWADDPCRLAISNGRNRIFVSHASLWEINIKINRGKLSTPGSTRQLLMQSRYMPLPICLEHVEQVRDLPDHHRDPFDRMLIAQAETERLTIITRDCEFANYDVATMAA